MADDAWRMFVTGGVLFLEMGCQHTFVYSKFHHRRHHPTFNTVSCSWVATRSDWSLVVPLALRFLNGKVKRAACWIIKFVREMLIDPFRSGRLQHHRQWTVLRCRFNPICMWHDVLMIVCFAKVEYTEHNQFWAWISGISSQLDFSGQAYLASLNECFLANL